MKFARKRILGLAAAFFVAGIALVFVMESSEVPFLVRLKGQVTLANLATGAMRMDKYTLLKVTSTEPVQSDIPKEVQRLGLYTRSDEWVQVHSHSFFPSIYRKHADRLYDAIWALYYALEAFPKDQRDSPEYHLFLARGLKLLELREYWKLDELAIKKQQELIEARDRSQ